MCKHAVTGRRLSKTEMARHKKKHIKEGHLNIDADFTPQQAEELRLNSHCPLFWTVLQNAGLDPTDEDAANEYH